ncbi:hypothetical protein MRI28_11030 [Nocardiopsis dassonvillei]|uniref:hypothetical protein n=1 Tax=Nocardiopsis dassonvillei TaxID=2014 RepID=UPI00200D0C9D|nr:hypothetical protein [Nocardiopsis dassonvillei]MCK9870166.1 hypothetical protein [Nocardiopsis dassonvillei]
MNGTEQHRTTLDTNRNGKADPFREARDAFMTLRGLAFTCEWRRFPWTYGADVDKALVGPQYLGHVALGLKDGTHWGYQSRDGRQWRYVRRDRLDLLVNAVVDEFAGFTPPLPRRNRER